MNLRQIEALVWLARLGSFRATAARLHTTQPAISLRIRDLERELGAVLFERNRREVRLTAEGRDCLARAERILLACDEFRDRPGREAVRGRVSVGVSEVIALTWLPRLFSAMDAAYPDVQMDVTIDTTPTLLRGLESGAQDVVLAGTSQLTTTHAATDLGSVPFVWLGSERIRGARAPYAPRDLAERRIITWPRDAAIHRSVEDWFQSDGASPTRRIACNTAAAMADLAAAGLGITLLPTAIVESKLRSRQLRILPTAPAFPPLRYWAVHVPRRRGSLGKAVAEVAQRVADFRAGQRSR